MENVDNDNNYDAIKPFKNDILVRVVDKNAYSHSTIITQESSARHDAHYFEVLKVGEEVTEVSPGDICLINWRNTMVPFQWGVERLSITDPKQIEVILDY